MNKERPKSGFGKILKDNGLSITLFLLFLLFLIGQAFTGWAHHNEEEKEHHQPEISLASYLSSGDFGEAVFENWESEFLQMVLYVVLTTFLFQRGSSESKDPDKKEEVDEDPNEHRHNSKAPAAVRKGGLTLAIYNNSLSLAFLFLFLFSFIAHAIFGTQAHNGDAIKHGQPLLSTAQYMGSAQFWFESFQNWQSEFIAIFAIVVLSIWLRQKGSPESKPVYAAHTQTGE